VIGYAFDIDGLKSPPSSRVDLRWHQVRYERREERRAWGLWVLCVKLVGHCDRYMYTILWFRWNGIGSQL